MLQQKHSSINNSLSSAYSTFSLSSNTTATSSTLPISSSGKIITTDLEIPQRQSSLPQQHQQEKTSSPIIRELDRYPLPAGRNKNSEYITNTGSKQDNVTQLMNMSTATVTQTPTNIHTAKSLPRDIHKRYISGQLSISTPEGFTHVSSANGYSIPTIPIAQQQALGSPRSPRSPPSPNLGPPVSSYRESRSFKESRLASQLRDSLSNNSIASSSNGSTTTIVNRGSLSPSSTTNSTTAISMTTPTNDKRTSLASKRQSRFPFFNKRSSISMTQSNFSTIHTISDPILEHSTSVLVMNDGRRQSEISLPGSKKTATIHSVEEEPSTVSTSVEQSPSSTHTQEEFTISSSPEISSNSPVLPKQEQQPQSGLGPELPSGKIPMNENQWKMKLRESDDKRRNMMIEYQQKLDAERKKTLDLEKKLQALMKEQNSAEKNTITSLLQRPENSLDAQSKIKGLQAQRDVLRQALITLRDTKDLEITYYKQQLSRISKNGQAITNNNAIINTNNTTNNSGNSSNKGIINIDPTESLLSRSPVIPSEHKFRSSRVLGIGPFLPLAGPVPRPVDLTSTR